MMRKKDVYWMFLLLVFSLLAYFHYDGASKFSEKVVREEGPMTFKLAPTMTPVRMTHDPKWINRNALAENESKWVKRSSILLEKVMKKCESPSYRVPNVIHYIWFGCKREFDFYHFISVVTTRANIDPCAIIFHGDCEPDSMWWKIAVKHIGSLYLVYHEMPNEIFGNKLEYIQHKAMVARLEVLIKWGGIYFDDTVLGLSSFHPLRNFSAVMGMEDPKLKLLTSSIIVAEPDSKFVKEWYNGSYHDYRPKIYPYNSGRYSFLLWKRKPNIGLFVERKKLLPIWNQWRQVWEQKYPWKKNYAIHFVNHELKELQKKNLTKTPNFPQDIFTMDSAFGEISRLALKKLNIDFDIDSTK